MKTEKARSLAAQWYADVVKGEDPGGERQSRRDGSTMNALFDAYLSEHAEKTKKPSSVANDRRLIEKKLRALLGKRKVADITRAEIAKLHGAMSDTPYEANRCLALLSKAMNLAEIWGMRPDGSNPCRHIKKFTETKRKRFLSINELRRLGEVLNFAEVHGYVVLPPAEGKRATEIKVVISEWCIAAIRLLVLTGARKGEILGLMWDWVDLDRGRANLPDSKSGEKILILPPPALELLRSLQRSDDNAHVIRGGRPGAPLVNLKDPWLAIREAAALGEVRIHDLRHSFASVGVAGGASLPIIGALLGHSQPSTTQRYAHLHDDPLQAAAAAIGATISEALSPHRREYK